jgi:hypothetical protein
MRGEGEIANVGVRRQKAEGRKQKAESRSQKPEGRRQKAEGRRQIQFLAISPFSSTFSK